MSTISNLWSKFNKSRAYRRAFVESYLKRSIPFQIAAMRKARGWSQARLAKASGLTQGVISRAEDPMYGDMTLNTILRIGAGFDVAFVGQFVSFSEFARLVDRLSEESVQVPSFVDDVMPQLNAKVELTGAVSKEMTLSPGTGKMSALLQTAREYLREGSEKARLLSPLTASPIGAGILASHVLDKDSYSSRSLRMVSGGQIPMFYRAAITPPVTPVKNVLSEARA